MGRTKGVPARVAPPSGAEDGVWTVLSRARPGAGDDDSSSRGSCALVADASASAASDDDHGPQPNGGSRTLAAAAPASDSPHGPRPNRLYPRTGKRGAPQAFPRKVYEILSEQPPAIVSWNTSGRSFSIHDMDRFVSEVLQKYFAHQKFSSFQRQLNLYGFKRIEPGGGGEPAGSYFHASFRRGREDLIGDVRRAPQSHRSGRGGGGTGRDSGRDRAWSGGGAAARSGGALAGTRKRKAASEDSDDDAGTASDAGSYGAGGADDDAPATKLRRTTRVAARAVRSRVRELARRDAEPDDVSSSGSDDDDDDDDMSGTETARAEHSDVTRASNNAREARAAARHANAATPPPPPPSTAAAAGAHSPAARSVRSPATVVGMPPPPPPASWAPAVVQIKDELNDDDQDGDGDTPRAAAALPFRALPTRLGSIGDGGLLQRTASISSEGWDFVQLGKPEDVDAQLRDLRAAASAPPTGVDSCTSFDVSVDGVIPRSMPAPLPGGVDPTFAGGLVSLLRQPSWASAVMPFPSV